MHERRRYQLGQIPIPMPHRETSFEVAVIVGEVERLLGQGSEFRCPAPLCECRPWRSVLDHPFQRNRDEPTNILEGRTVIRRVVASLHDLALDHSNSSHQKCPSCDLGLISKQAERTEASVR